MDKHGSKRDELGLAGASRVDHENSLRVASNAFYSAYGTSRVMLGKRRDIIKSVIALRWLAATVALARTTKSAPGGTISLVSDIVLLNMRMVRLLRLGPQHIFSRLDWKPPSTQPCGWVSQDRTRNHIVSVDCAVPKPFLLGSKGLASTWVYLPFTGNEHSAQLENQ